MSFQFSDAVRNAAADTIETTAGTGPTLTIRTGAPPVNCGAADSGTVLATITLPSDWASIASSGVKSLLGSWVDSAADATGRAGHFRIKQGATCHMQGLCSEPWQGSKVYAVGDQVHNSGNLYRATVAGTSAVSGGPTAGSGSVTDGGVTWAFVQAGTDLAIDNASLNVGQQFTVSAFSLTAGGA